MQQNLIDKAGAWYSYNGDRIGQGKEKVRQFLHDNPEIANDIDQKLRELLLVKPRSRAEEAMAIDEEPVMEEA